MANTELDDMDLNQLLWCYDYFPIIISRYLRENHSIISDEIIAKAKEAANAPIEIPKIDYEE